MKETGNKRDIELVKRAQAGDDKAEEELLQRHKSLVRTKANLYYIIGADEEDVLQEGMIGLFDAMNSFDPARGPSFAAFASLCIDRHILSAVRSAGRLKNGPLNESLSFSSPLADGETELGDSIPAGSDSDPESRAIFSDLYARIHGSGLLSGFESEVLALMEQGLSAADIAARLGRPAKSVDNASQRIRRKLQKLLT